jgi:hypothetical protein
MRAGPGLCDGYRKQDHRRAHSAHRDYRSQQRDPVAVRRGRSAAVSAELREKQHGSPREPLICDPVYVLGEGQNWSGWPDSNRRPPDPQSGALTRLRYIPMCPWSGYVRGPDLIRSGLLLSFIKVRPASVFHHADRLRRAGVVRVDPCRAAVVLPRACPELPP